MSNIVSVLDPRLVPRLLCCYRLQAWAVDYDEEEVWSLVQSHRGYLAPRADCIDFWIPAEYELLLVLKYPDLIRRPDLDYI